MRYTLTPTWDTAVGLIAQLVETDEPHFQLEAHEEVIATLAHGESSIQLTDGAERITKVLVDGIETAFTLATDTITFAAITNSQGSTVKLMTGRPTFIFLNGALPPGLNVNTSGLVSGRTGNVIQTPVGHYEFTMRISNESHVRDRQFAYDVVPFFYAGYYNPATMQGTVLDDETGLHYHPIGTLQLETPVSITLDILDQDGVQPPTNIRAVRNLDPNNDTIFGTLPPGLALNGIIISGYIDPDTPPGKYFFNIRVEDPVEFTSYIFMIEVVNSVNMATEVIPEMIWLTPGGLLGTVYEGRLTFMGVEASVIGGPNPLPASPTYTLATGSGPLPPGLTLEATTGNFIGRIGPITRSTTYQFTIRATSDYLFVERTFSLNVVSVFNAIPFYDVRLKLSILDKFEMIGFYRNAIPSDSLYRPSDYGLAISDIYVIRGLDARNSLRNAVQNQTGIEMTIGLYGYHRPIDLILGDHAIAVARKDNGEVVYEVLYRPLYDRQEGAGGFEYGTDIPVASPVIYSRHAEPMTVYPCSVRNERYDLANKLGMATNDTSKQHLLGPDGVEGLPRWMLSEQIQGDPSSVLGFIPALVIAYLNPGESKHVLNLLAKQTAGINFGRVYTFNRYYISLPSADHIQL